MSGRDFELTSHEVMRGVKVSDGTLRLRPSGLVLLGTALDGLIAAVSAVIALLAGGLWMVIALPALAMVVDAAQRMRVALIAELDCVVVRNRRRRRVVPISEFEVATTASVEGAFRQPVYTFLGWRPGREWEVGVIRTRRGESIECDALISSPVGNSADPTPTSMKVATLNRWVESRRASRA